MECTCSHCGAQFQAEPAPQHRLLCGDATDANVVRQFGAGGTPAATITDPPYNVSLGGYGAESDDSLDEGAYEQWSRQWFKLWGGVDGRLIVTPGCKNLADWCRWFTPYHVAPWTKTNGITNGKVSRFWCWEPILFFGERWPRTRPNDVFDFPIGLQAEVGDHPCPKPLSLWRELVECYSEPGDLILEPFAGSGTTVIACEQTGRQCWAAEISPKFCDLVLTRWKNLTGQTPEKISG